MKFKVVLACTLCLLGGLGTGAFGQKRYADFSDEAVEKAIKKGVEYLWSQQKPDGSWPPHGENAYPVGPTALVTYALLASGATPQDPRMAKALQWLTYHKTGKTYSLGLRANVWLLANRTTGNRYRKHLRADAMRLVGSSPDGAYGYIAFGGGVRGGRWDNSNSQYGLLGVWAGAMGLVEVPRGYWQKVLLHWVRHQRPDGGWDYQGRGDSTATMTAAGVASLYVCFDALFTQQFLKCGLGDSRELKAIKRGLNWFDRKFEDTLTGAVSMGHGDIYYYLYGVERVGLACGYKYFGMADWYKLGATKLVQTQSGGSWYGLRDPHVSTSFALLFLIRGRHPILFNKLEFTGDWNNRPRDLANLTRWTSRTFERTVNWQIINLKVPVREWHDAPIIYLSGAKLPTFTEDELGRLRTFVLQGGTIFVCTECDGTGFSKGIRKVYAKLFPKYELTPAGPKHDLYSVHFPLQGKPKFYTVTNGIRALVIHTDEDLPLDWQRRAVATRKQSFQAAANVFMYVTDKGSLRHRGVSLWPDEASFSANLTVTLARLQHSGNYDPEPLAYQRFRRLMGTRAQTSVQVVGPIKIEELPNSGAQVASLTGTGRFKLTGEETKILKDFVTGGGTLVVDAAGGSKYFAGAAEEALSGMFGARAVRQLSETSPLYRLGGMEINRVKYRRRTRRKLGRAHRPILRAVSLGGRAAVIYSREDLTAGLVGYPSYACDGYDPESAFELMRNVVVYAARQKAE